jgi:uncharacterized OsmC-like protein
LTLIDAERLRGNYEGLIERLRDEPEEGFRRVGVDARIVQDVTVDVTFEQYEREWSLVGDEAVSRGGHETGPSPLRYFMSGIGICQLGWWAKGSATLGYDVENLAVGVRTFLDMRGEHGFGDHPTYPQWFGLHVDVTSPATPEQVLEMIDWGDERCPLGVLVRRAIPIYERVVHNGTLIRDTVPADLEQRT